MTLCLSAINVHFAQRQSLQPQYRLCPLRADTTPWFLQRAHFGVLWYRSAADIEFPIIALSAAFWSFESKEPAGDSKSGGCIPFKKKQISSLSSFFESLYDVHNLCSKQYVSYRGLLLYSFLIIYSVETTKFLTLTSTIWTSIDSHEETCCCSRSHCRWHIS